MSWAVSERALHFTSTLHPRSRYPFGSTFHTYTPFGVTMRHTGLFKITDLTYRPGAEGGLARALQIEATCTACGSTSVWSEQDMEHVAGGTVLACRTCGTRQAISNARLIRCPSDIRHPQR